MSEASEYYWSQLPRMSVDELVHRLEESGSSVLQLYVHTPKGVPAVVTIAMGQPGAPLMDEVLIAMTSRIRHGGGQGALLPQAGCASASIPVRAGS